MAEEGKIGFELVSPEQLLMSEDVEMVLVPGVEGDFGVLARHAPLISSLRPGVVGICRKGRQPEERYFVAGGFAEVTGERCTVLAEYPIEVSTMDRGEVEQELKNAREDLADAKDDKERGAAERRIAVSEAKLRALAA
ncbi:F0F1 ATP synthase subunit epsilon [Ferruginivarius sediminum]|uniref:ATP synthase epsilon chain n=1 Tax=Ferruginivarius sediminum TaxID=2661937 RepID=A0A369TC86_9PROT|nr:F0F1 ATP synthase subunit epsilon [Ferruginivarius sediminum]RDD62919.1 F0F1 ATP synthase subunit epsilon [Ferruginivarius sediminum]